MTHRIPSGAIDVTIYMDTGGITSVSAATWSVFANKNGITSTHEFTTPQVQSVSSMPGVYRLLVDEYTTVSVGAATEQMALYITAAGIPPRVETVELFAPALTSAQVSGIVEQAVYQRVLDEPTAAPSWGSMPFDVAIEWVAARNVNRQHQASSSVAIYSSANSQIASASVGFTSTSANQGQWL